MDYKGMEWHINPGAKASHRNTVRKAKRAVQRSAGAEEELVSVSIVRHLPHNFEIKNQMFCSQNLEINFLNVAAKGRKRKRFSVTKIMRGIKRASTSTKQKDL